MEDDKYLLLPPVASKQCAPYTPVPPRTLIGRLEEALESLRPSEEAALAEHMRVASVNRKLICAAAAENRRWRCGGRHSSDMPMPSLVALCEQTLGDCYSSDAITEALRPHYDVVNVRDVPSAVEHNNEHCRARKRSRPAVEDWS